MDSVNTFAGDVRLIGGRLCLDFVNTVDLHEAAVPKEYLKSYADMLIWGEHAGVLDADTAAQMRQVAAADPLAAEQIREWACTLREALYRLFIRQAATSDLELLNQALAALPTPPALHPTAAGFAWDWPADRLLEQVLGPVLRSAADLLTAPDLAQVRRCAGEGCGWLFLDLSRNHSRRWCSMEDCGNRAKARRHYAKRTAG